MKAILQEGKRKEVRERTRGIIEAGSYNHSKFKKQSRAERRTKALILQTAGLQPWLFLSPLFLKLIPSSPGPCPSQPRASCPVFRQSWSVPSVSEGTLNKCIYFLLKLIFPLHLPRRVILIHFSASNLFVHYFIMVCIIYNIIHRQIHRYIDRQEMELFFF